MKVMWKNSQLRWKRSGHIERFRDLRYTISEGPLYAWWVLKSESFIAGKFVAILYYSCSGGAKSIVRLHFVDSFLILIAPALYNVYRSLENKPSPLKIFVAFVFESVMNPYVHLAAAATVWEKSPWELCLYPHDESEEALKSYRRKIIVEVFSVIWLFVVGNAFFWYCYAASP